MQNRDNDIFTAICNQDIKSIENLVKSGIDLNIHNEKEMTPIEYAASLKYWTCVETIAQHRKVESDMADTNGTRYAAALLDAVKDESVNAVKKLLDANTPMTFRFDKTGNYALHTAVLKKNVEIIKLLLTHQVGLMKLNKEKKTAIQLAAYNKSWDIVELIAKDNIDPDDKAHFGEALLEAVKADRLDTAKCLLKAKAISTWHTTLEHDYCLHLAVKNNNKEMINLLLKYDVDCTEKNIDKKTPIELACSLGHWECAAQLMNGKHFTFKHPVHASKALITSMQARQYQLVNYLIQAGASTKDLSEKEGDTPLHVAVKKNDIKLIKILLKNEALPLYPNREGKTAIELASELQQWDNVEVFLKKEKKVMTLTQYYKNAHYKKVLCNAIRYNNYYVTECLLQRKIDCQDTNGEMGNIALYWAIKNKNPTMVALLLSYGANAEVKNKNSQSMYDLALVMNAKMCYQRMMDHKKENELSAPRKNSSEKIKLYLQHLQCDVTQQSWKVKNIFGCWVEGTPYHVKKIQFILNNMNSDHEDHIFNTYTKMLDIFCHIKPSTKRHPSTAIFYGEKRKELTSFISQQIILNTALSYPLVLNQPLPTLSSYMSSTLYQDVITQPMDEPPSYQEALIKTNQAVMHETLALSDVPPIRLYPRLPDILLSLPPTNESKWPLLDEKSLLDQTVAPTYMTVTNHKETFTSHFPQVPTHVAFFPMEKKAIEAETPTISEATKSSLQMNKILAIAE